MGEGAAVKAVVTVVVMLGMMACSASHSVVRSEQPIDPGVLRAISDCKQEVLMSGVVPLAEGVSGLWTETPGPGIRVFWRCMATKRAMGNVRDENQLREEVSMAVHECDQIVQWAGLSSSGFLVTMGPGATMFWQCMSEKGYGQE